MGIDLGFTEESLIRCKYALCRPYRKKLVGFYSDPSDGNSELAEYRSREKYVDMFHLRQEEPTLYRSILDGTRGDENRQDWPWNKHWFGDFYADRKKARRLNPYVETKLGGRVLFEKMPKGLKEEWMQKVDSDSLISAWWSLPFERHEGICRPCPVRPLDETNCYIRFSNYPGMNSFRAGFLLTALYSTTLGEDKLRGAYFSFPHLDRQKGELPKDKLGQLYEMCQGTPINKGAELFFNKVVDVLDKAIPDNVESTAEKINLEEAPFVDEFLSTFIYREEPYSQYEIKQVLPYLETLQEIAEWAIFDADVRPARANIVSFKDRLGSLITALKIGQKYGIDPYVSY
jgi:hypothetical protein